MTDDPKTSAGRRAATHPSEYLWTADTADAAHIRAAVLATMTREPVLIITGPACFFVRVNRADPLDGLAPSAHVSGGINVEAAEAFLLELRAEQARKAQEAADLAAAEAQAAAPDPRPDDIATPAEAAEAAEFFGVPIDPDATDATLA